ncbi:MAG: DNA recombination protein RmuC [Candidatus Ancaeobacter aquaticus]|nr:DNA recombination protein RmuC [Candidatus Ancaeobacter aquaticus]
MDIFWIIISFVFGAAIAIIFIKFVMRNTREDLKSQFVSATQDMLKNNNEHFMALAKEKFDHEQTKAKTELDLNRQKVESSVLQLSDQLKKYESLMREFEKDRGDKYGSLEENLRNTTEITNRLQCSTEKLNTILGNVKLRGHWGEKIADDILKYSGLVEGLHYKKNTAQETVNTRPDFMFNLSDGHKVYMDVKFPLSAYLGYINAQSDVERTNKKNQFVSDVKLRIKEITKREYINPDEKTLDYILLFIPNEQVYSFANEVAPGLIDEAIQKKVILCSPWTLYAVLRIIWQAWENYHTSQSVQHVLTLIQSFLGEYDKFCDKMTEMGDRLEKVQKSYGDLVGTRQRKLDRKIDKIEEYRKGQPDSKDHEEISEETVEQMQE